LLCQDGADVQDVLNEEYAVFADPDAKRESITWHFGKLSTYDETLLQIEEERYEVRAAPGSNVLQKTSLVQIVNS